MHTLAAFTYAFKSGMSRFMQCFTYWYWHKAKPDPLLTSDVTHVINLNNFLHECSIINVSNQRHTIQLQNSCMYVSVLGIQEHYLISSRLKLTCVHLIEGHLASQETLSWCPFASFTLAISFFLKRNPKETLSLLCYALRWHVWNYAM